MRLILLNGKRMTDKAKTHEYLERRLRFPDYYGENLDALWDMLTSITDPIDIRLINYKVFINNLGPYGEAIIETFRDAAKENKNLLFEFE